MNEGSALRQRLRRQTGEAQRRQVTLEAEIDDRHGEPARPGDIFVLPETRELPVEWAILDQDATDPGRLLAIPADENPMLGSADVALPQDAARGSLVLRCQFGVWTDADPFDPKLRTGTVEPEHLERARRRRRDFERGLVAGTVAEREVDLETDYLDWQREVLEPACSALPARPALTEPQGLVGAEVVEFRRPGGWSAVNRPLAIAASILLVITAALAWQVVRFSWDRTASTETHRRELAELELARKQTEEAHGRDLAALRAEREQAEAEHRRQLEDLEASNRPRARLNLPFVVLAAARTRSPEAVQELPSGAGWVMLILQLEDPEPAPRYRLRIVRRSIGKEVWSSDELKPIGAELSLALPGSLLPAGDYVMELRGLRDGQPGSVEEYELVVR